MSEEFTKKLSLFSAVFFLDNLFEREISDHFLTMTKTNVVKLGKELYFLLQCILVFVGWISFTATCHWFSKQFFLIQGACNSLQHLLLVIMLTVSKVCQNLKISTHLNKFTLKRIYSETLN